MASNSRRKSGSSARSTGRKRVVIGAEETVRVKYNRDKPQVESERRHQPSARQRARSPRTDGAGNRLANVKRDERERRQRAISRRRTLVVAAVVAGAVLLLWAVVALWRAPIFSVDTVKVTGNERVSAATVIKAAGIPTDATLLRLPAKRIRTAVETNPWIASARVVRRFPHTLEIRVTERVPVAIVDAGGTNVWLIDGGGVWLAKGSADGTGTLPVVRDIENLVPKAATVTTSTELTNALAVLSGISPELRARVRSVSAPTVDRTALILAHGVQVFVGSSDDIQKKDAVARAILAQNKNAVYVNVRVVNRPTWRGLDSGN